MNSDEFHDFLIEHSARFPFIKELFKSDPEDETKTAERLQKAWFATLKKVPYQTAVDASNLMYANEKFQPRYATQHLAQIMQLAHKAKANANVGKPGGLKPEWKFRTDPVTGEREAVYDCLLCRDAGFVTIYQPRMVRNGTIARIWAEVQQKAGDAFFMVNGTSLQCAIHCSCTYGRSLGTNQDTRFDPRKHSPVGWTDEEVRNNLAEATKAQRPAEDDPFT